MSSTSQTWPKEIIVYTDGASRGNPGPASIGIHVISLEGTVLFEHKESLGTQTNNFAEYTAVLRSLELARSYGVRSILIRSDSELMVKQMKGEYKVKSPAIQPLFEVCKGLLSHFEKVRFEHVRREQNKEADRLANEALDEI
jgi:ribonuclease HI